MRQPETAASGPALYAESADGTLIAYWVHAAGRPAASGVSAGLGGTAASSGGPDASGGSDAAGRPNASGRPDASGRSDVAGGSDVAGRSDASAPPVLLVHGFASNSRVTWLGTGWVGTLVDAGRTVVTLDLRGHGESDKPIEASAYRPDRLADDLVAVLDSAGAERADVIAYSMGNRALSALAAEAPARMRRAVVGGAGPNELFASWDLDDVRGVLLHDRPAADPLIELVLRPAITAGADREALLACVEGVAGAPLVIPAEVPALFVAGEHDAVPRGVEEFAATRGSDVIRLAGRDHVSTLTSRDFKTAAVRFLA